MSFNDKVVECLSQIAALHLNVLSIDERTLRIIIKLADNPVGHQLFDIVAASEPSLPKAEPGARMEAMLKIMKLTAFFIEEIRKIETP